MLVFYYFLDINLSIHGAQRKNIKHRILKQSEYRGKEEPIKPGKLLGNVINPQLSKDLTVHVHMYVFLHLLGNCKKSEYNGSLITD
jgi:hypothetical protein